MARGLNPLRKGLATLALAASVIAQDGFAGDRASGQLSLPDVATGRFIIELDPSATKKAKRDDDPVASIVDGIKDIGYDARVQDDFTSVSSRFQGASVEVTSSSRGSSDEDAIMDDIKRVPGVADVWPVRTIALNATFKPADASPDWNPHVPTRVDEIHKRNITGAGQRVCVIDSGAQADHPALAGRIVGGRNMFDDSDDITDCNGHGTFVSSNIVAMHKDFRGSAPDAEVFMYKIFDCEGSTGNDILLKGILAADADDCDIISLSVGADNGYSNSLLSRVASEIAQDRLFVIAAGNAGEMGPYFASTPASGRGVVSVGSVDAAQIMAWPATIVSSSGESLDFPYVTADGSKLEEAIDVVMDFNTADSCNVEWDSGSEDRAVLTKRGVCYQTISYNVIGSSGYGYSISFDSYNQGVFYQNSIDPFWSHLRLFALTDASVGEWARQQVEDGHTLRLRIEADADPATFPGNVPTAGQMPSFSSWGPTFEQDFSPIISAPGGWVYGAFPGSTYAVASGTSFATPYLSGVAALWYSQGKKDSAEFIRRLTSGAVTLPAFDAGSGKVLHDVAPLAQQGSGMVDAVKIFDQECVLLSAPTLSLNDTDNRVESHTIRIQNRGSEAVTFNITHEAAATVDTRNSILYTNPYYPPHLNATGVLEAPETVTIGAGETQDIEIRLTGPDLEPESGALWSGRVQFFGSNNEMLSVPYIGFEASIYNWTPLHHGPESYYFDRSDGYNKPVDFENHIYRPAEGESPETWFAFRYGTYEFSLDLVGEDWTTDKFSYPPPEYGVGSDAWLGPLRQQAIPGGGYLDFPMRDVTRFNSGRFTTFRHLANGTEIPSGRYRVFSRALRMFGDARNPDDWQLFLSDAFNVQLRDDPIPGFTSTAVPTPTSTSAAVTTTAAPTTTGPVSVPGTTTTLTASATPTGIAGFSSLRLQRVREESSFFYDVDGWMELHVEISMPNPVPGGSVLSFGVPDEIVEMADGYYVQALSAYVGMTSFDSQRRVFTIEFGDWVSTHRNMKGEFWVFCRLNPEYAAQMKLGTYILQFPTADGVIEAPIYYTAVDRTAIYEGQTRSPFDGTELFTADIEVPGRLGAWDYVRLQALHSADGDAIICANSTVSVGKVGCATGRLGKLRDVTDEAVETCELRNFIAQYEGPVASNEAVRFRIGNIQAQRGSWTLPLVYLVDIQFSNGTLALLDQDTIRFEKNARTRALSDYVMTGERL
ncbi:alkaline elastase YaB [Stachybotrys elegans]|uniref:Alkaline elastase YaB n=1 Tax=Stachybotrys elegans TaxID=80388 RepID=A0A8K0SMV8_9HYPO|nr:alkaline elastase YaB [Stachybotrys elegans]